MHNEPTPERRRLRAFKPALAVTLGVAALGLTALAANEIRSSRIQARHFSELARDLTYRVEAGPSPAISYPAAGPFDERLGYSRLPQFIERLSARGFAIDAQARLSPALLRFTADGYFAPYPEKTQAGLRLLDCSGENLFAARHPERIYQRFEAIPPLVVETLLFIENRQLLDAENPTRNPAVEWTRLGRAVMSQAVRLVDASHDVPGGSTLATQIEKYRHSPEGITGSAAEKLKQMFSASLRAYRDGEDTLPARRQIVVDYLNTVPLSALAGYGEVNGLGDGLWVWYGADFDAANRALFEAGLDRGDLRAQALAYRQVLSLMIAHRRPSSLLANGGREQLASLTDSHLRLLAAAGIVSPELRDLALALRPRFRDPVLDPVPVETAAGKTASVMRARVATTLDVPLYSLDRLDLMVKTTLDRDMQDGATASLLQLGDPKHARAAGLIGERLLDERETAKVYYSFALWERGPDANRVRVQTDNFDQPLDINEGTKLELGSTAKLRTLATYLEVVASLHREHAGLEAAELRRLDIEPRDRLSRWAVDYLVAAKDRSLAAMLDAALERRYSGNPGEGFFTGGGLHSFDNFKREDNGRNPTVREALRDSVNLSFIRMMRDIVRYYMYRPGSSARALQEAGSAQRAEYLSRFADREGRVYLQRYYRKYQGKPPEALLDTLVAETAAGGDLSRRISRGRRRRAGGVPRQARARGGPQPGRPRPSLRTPCAGQVLARRRGLPGARASAGAVAGLVSAPTSRGHAAAGLRCQCAGAPGGVFVALQDPPSRRAGKQNLHAARDRCLRADPPPLAAARLSLRAAGTFACHGDRQLR
jgi:membrane peptidoglycan carboxypeptidase